MNPKPDFEKLLADAGIGELLNRIIPAPTIAEILTEIRRTPGFDPWAFLLRNARQDSDKKVFAAIASQESGWRALSAYATKRTRNSEPTIRLAQRAKAKGNQREMSLLADLETIRQAKHDAQFRTSEQFGGRIEQAVLEGDFAFISRAVKAAMNSAKKPGYRDVAANYAIQSFLVENWICFGATGIPGFLFFTDAALRNFIQIIFPQCGANVDRTARRLGLVSGPNIVKGVHQDAKERIVLMKGRTKEARGTQGHVAIITKCKLPNGRIWKAQQP